MLFATQHTHEHVVTQHVPLSHVAPQALLTLRRTGQCAFRIPRWWFQRFNPGLRNRRVKSIAVSAPGVLGPYVAMDASLALVGSHRTLSSISLSSGMNDGGFDVTVAPEMYLPFEGLSLEADTSWTFGFPPDPAVPNQVLTDVDYATISDVILHVQYTADSGQPVLDGPPELLSFIDVRQMDADVWSQLVAGAAHQGTLVIRDLVPRFLSDYTVDSLVDTVALLQDGTVVTGSLVFTVGAGNAAGTVTIGLAQNQAIDWDQLSKVFVVVKLR